MALFKSKKKYKILIAEDEENIRQILKMALEAAGFEVSAFENGKLALEAIPKQMPDLIILDVMMPLKNGFEVCYEVKNNTKLEAIPVIILTAATQSSTKSDEYWRVKSRADVFMTKPFKSSELIKKIHELIETAKSTQNQKGRFRI
jgi:DNA-binding response OmpR family regulator